jgi:copper chaperone CopZ
MAKLTLQIDGMSCGHCVGAVHRALAALPGVEVESVEIGRARVRFDETATSPAALVGAVRDAGYSASLGDVAG